MKKGKNETYSSWANRTAQKSPVFLNAVKAFLCGGSVCAIGQALSALYTLWGAGKEIAGTLTSVTLIFLAALLTGLGVFDDIAKVAGAGTLLPITGFSNAMTSPAIDAKSEGWVLGVGAKIFTVAGPVILYGTLASALYGVIYFLISNAAKIG